MQIIWFRRDLRVADNESVAKATADNAPVLPCFIIDPWFYQWADKTIQNSKFKIQNDK